MIESEMFLNTTGFKSLNSIDEFKNGRKDEEKFFFDFFDILSERRGTSDILWASREWNPSVAYSQSEKLMGDSIKTMVLNSPHLKHKIFEVRKKTLSQFYINFFIYLGQYSTFTLFFIF